MKSQRFDRTTVTLKGHEVRQALREAKEALARAA
jgi:hypothetical protein